MNSNHASLLRIVLWALAALVLSVLALALDA